MQRLSLKVVERHEVAEGVASFILGDAHGRPLPSWSAGAHIAIRLPNGLTRQYSLCGKADDALRYRIAVLNEQNGRGGSSYIHANLNAGDVLEAGEPVNHFNLEPGANYLFIAGGIGITPLLPMIDSVEAKGADWRLFYGARDRHHTAFHDELASFGDRVHFWPQDERGVLPLQDLVSTAGAALIYACGPGGMLDSLQAVCDQNGAGERLRIERFSGTGLPETPAGESSEFIAVVASTGQEVVVKPDQTLLNALLDAGVDALFSCEEGTCGTCELKVIEGTPDHRDSILSESQKQSGQYIMPCVSRALSGRIVLDI